MPAYYTKTTEADPVYHSTTACHEYQDIDDDDLMTVSQLATRRLCHVCVGLEAKK
jgi:hypothetical protein